MASFRHDPGTFAFPGHADGISNRWSAATTPYRLLWRKPVEVDKSKIKEFKLDSAGGRQRLTFDHGADRIEIGPTLREPEREWLHQVLETWRTA